LRCNIISFIETINEVYAGLVSLRRPSSGSRSQSLGHLVLQRKRADCGIASPVIAALCGQNANRQSEQERGGDSDYALGHH
jgi:hypothetical protein